LVAEAYIQENIYRAAFSRPLRKILVGEFLFQPADRMNSDGNENHRITVLLRRVSGGDRTAQSELLPIVYAQLLRMAEKQFRSERRGHTLQPTALISELYLRVIRDGTVDWQDRAHFFAVSAQTIRRILVDHARSVNAHRRPNPHMRLDLDDVLVYSDEHGAQIVEIDETLHRLAERDPRMAQIVEMRVFAGLSIEEMAAALGISERTVKRDWAVARAWLSKELR
jgi:RNA polymerase sigma factor (TIGR02999 family)